LNGQNYFLPVDVEVQDIVDAVDVEYRAIDQGRILRAIERAKGVKIIILDAGRDNSLARLRVAARSWDAGLARIDPAENMVIAYAAAPGQTAADGNGRNSPFTAALVKYIKQPGVEITTMFRRLASEVYDETKGAQHPEFSSSLSTAYYLYTAESDTDAWNRVRESTNPVDFKEFIRKYPASSFAREALVRARIAAEEEARKEAERRGASEAEKKRKEEEARKKRNILETGYSLLKEIGGEEPIYGLYSYAILVNDSARSAKFLNNVFGVGFIAIPSVEETGTQPSQTNVLYLPLKRNKAKEWAKGRKLGKERALRAAYTKNFYDYRMSRTLLSHLCISPADEIRRACEGDLSKGPYIFAYAKPASKITPVPPPFLFMDLSDVHERAFPEFIAAFKAQVKREDISDRAKIDTLRLKILNIVLTTADWLPSVRKSVADIVYSASGQTEEDKK